MFNVTLGAKQPGRNDFKAITCGQRIQHITKIVWLGSFSGVQRDHLLCMPQGPIELCRLESLTPGRATHAEKVEGLRPK